MNIECVKEKLIGAINKAERVTGKNLSLPVLRCVLLEVKDSKLFVRSTDLEVGIEVSLPVKVSKEGKVAVPADVFKSFLASIPDSDSSLTLSIEDETLHVKTKSVSTHIKTFSHEEFPSIPKLEGSTVVLPTDALLTGFDSVRYAASVSSMKPELSSVYMYSDEDSIVFVATDSFRLAEKRVAVDDFENFQSILIPHTNVGEVTKILSNTADKEITVTISENQIAFSGDNTYVTSRIIDGTFPDYQQIIPDNSSTTASVLKEDLVSVLRLSTIFSDKFNKINITASPDDDSVTLYTNNQDIGDNTSVLEADVNGEDVKMSFNHRYVQDCFHSIHTDSVVLSLGEGAPMVVKGVSDETFQYLVMPMNK